MNTTRTDWHYRCGDAFLTLRREFPIFCMTPLMCLPRGIEWIGLTIPETLCFQHRNDNQPQRR